MIQGQLQDAAVYAVYCVLCAIEKTPEKEVARCLRDLTEEDELKEADFEFSIRKGRKGIHYFSKGDILDMLKIYGSSPRYFYGEEKAKALGLIYDIII